MPAFNIAANQQLAQPVSSFFQGKAMAIAEKNQARKMEIEEERLVREREAFELDKESRAAQEARALAQEGRAKTAQEQANAEFAQSQEGRMISDSRVEAGLEGVVKGKDPADTIAYFKKAYPKIYEQAAADGDPNILTPDEAQEMLEIIREARAKIPQEEKDDFTLKPNEVRFGGADGKPIASNPKPATPAKVGQDIIDAKFAFESGVITEEELNARLKEIALGTGDEDKDQPYGTSLRGLALGDILDRVPDDRKDEAKQAISIAVAAAKKDPITGEYSINLPAEILQMLGVNPGTAIPIPPPENAANLPSGGTLFQQAGNIAGPVPFIQKIATAAPVLGIPATEATEAEGFATQMTLKIVEAFKRSDRGAVWDLKNLEEKFKISPKVFNSEQAYQSRMAQLSVDMDWYISDYSKSLGEDNLTSTEMKKRTDALQEMMEMRFKVAPPRMDTDEQWQKFKSENPPGTAVLVKKGGVWQVGRIPNE